jgi:hypothetical protein
LPVRNQAAEDFATLATRAGVVDGDALAACKFAFGFRRRARTTGFVLSEKQNARDSERGDQSGSNDDGFTHNRSSDGELYHGGATAAENFSPIEELGARNLRLWSVEKARRRRSAAILIALQFCL